MKTRFGCLTGTGLVILLVVAVLFFGTEAFSGNTLFSPGPLNAQAGTLTLGGVESHAATNGNCSACHAAPWSRDRMSDRCLNCHVDLKQDPKNFHVIMLTEAGLKNSCINCHTDHRGATASLTKASLVDFPHNKLGFSLQGHQENQNGSSFACSECHPTGYAQFDLSLCLSCHARINSSFTLAHQEAYGTTCLDCHDGIDTYNHNFNHQLVSFKLLGKHTSLSCYECHQGDRTIADFKSTSQACVSCHSRDDAHQGQLGSQCDQCHTADGWPVVHYDHSLAAFKLTGKHVNVACGACHQDFLLKDTTQVCDACHTRNDVHQGLLGTDCSQCHTTAGWSPATFDHSKAVFQLTGKHASVSCDACHVDLLFKDTPQVCFFCHTKDDPHQNQLGTVCDQCHTTNGWSPSTFDHSQAIFTLTGKHAGLACTACHTDLIFKNTPQVCGACHAKDDPHQGQLSSDCGSCHTPDGWSPSTFDHSQAPFKLIGKHASLACNACHTDLLFKNTPQNCYACHAKDDAHNGSLGQDCGLCHSPAGWSPSTFDHSTAPFKLTGQHVGLACSACHKDFNFKSAPTSCAACHAEPAYHQGMFGTDCASCHSTSGWVPASYNRPHAFPISHGGANTCRNCHPNSLSGYTCYTCHDQATMIAKHLEKNITNISDCVSCHPTGTTGN